MGSAHLQVKKCRLDFINNPLDYQAIKMESLKVVFLSIAIFALFDLARTDDDIPKASKCYVWKQGAFATQGGSTESGKQEKTCNENSYCYVAMKKAPGRQGLHAQKAQFEGDCIQKNDPMASDQRIDLDFPGDKPTCAKDVNGREAVCVCNKNLCNVEAILQEVLEGQGLGRTGSSENGASSILGASVFVFIASLMIAMQF